jgi:thiol-disulfide isomerase/thioredoxin
VTTRHADAPGIHWFDGEVAAAFNAAKQAGKPVLLYWGAIWCPPCQQLKATVFSRPEFIAKSQLFVPVYLDGDDPGAQRWGEKFAVTGYPTMLVLDANQREIERIAGGMDLGEYPAVLDAALADLQPVDALLRAALAGRRLSDSQCHRLAYNAWSLGEISPQELSARGRQLIRSSDACPATARAERMRLRLVATDFAARAEAGKLDKGAVPSALLAAQIDSLAKLIANHALAQNVADALYFDPAVFKAVRRVGPKFAQNFATNYTAVLEALAVDPRFTEADHIAAVGYKLLAAKTLAADRKVPADMALSARAQLDEVLRRNQIPYVRSGIVNAALFVFEQLGENDVAYRLVQGELGKTQTPYYYKADLADLAEGLGRKDEAVDWLAQAYAESRGSATRFQWGSQYLSGLLRMRPNDETTILQVGISVLRELAGPDKIYRRARLRLETLDRNLRAWNEASNGKHFDALVDLRGQLQATCAEIPAAEPARRTCVSFLAEAI